MVAEKLNPTSPLSHRVLRVLRILSCGVFPGCARTTVRGVSEPNLPAARGWFLYADLQEGSRRGWRVSTHGDREVENEDRQGSPGKETAGTVRDNT
jgi:hypothetical protein